MRSKQSEKGLLFFSPEKGDELRYFTNSPFERLMMEKPCGQSKSGGCGMAGIGGMTKGKKMEMWLRGWNAVSVRLLLCPNKIRVDKLLDIHVEKPGRTC